MNLVTQRSIHMQFTLTDEQQQLREAVARFVRDRYTFRDWRRCARELDGFDANTWRQISSLGWTAAAVPETYGGLGMGPVAQAVIQESLGAGLVLEPFWSSAVMLAEPLCLAGTEAQKSTWLPRIADGSVRGAFALLEPDTRYDWSAIACRARQEDDRWVLQGGKLAVLDAPHAHQLMVVARSSGSPGELEGLSLFRVAADAQGLVRKDFRTVDERRASDLSFESVQAELVGVAGDAAGVIEHTIDLGISALCAEAVGVMASTVEATVAYLKTRHQFGRPLAQFQVLRHRVADMVMALEQSRSLAMRCALSMGDSPQDRSRVAAAAKAQIGSAGRFIGESAVQLHGGIGVTDELQIGHFMKRLLAIDILLGDTRHHLARMARREAAL